MEASRCHITHLVLLLSFTALSRGQRLRTNVTLIDNGYEGLLIAIGPDIPENSKLIPRIEEYFVEMSQLLFTATKKRAFLRNITILVPKTWTKNSSYEQAGIEAFEKANVIIDKSNGVQGDNPYVKQKGECGQPGTFMHLTPAFVLNDAVARQYGTPPAKTVLHEWGHLRWGLFDEYPVDENDAHFYHDSISGRIEGVRCSRGVTGKDYKRVSDSFVWNCNPGNETNLPESACRFAPDVYNNVGTTSIMSHHYVTSVIGFCDNNNADTLDLHNDQAPNRQNRLCGGRSAWEVMREHEDFRNNNNPPVQGNIDTTPTFKVVQEQPKRYVLVLDVSGSMGGSRLENLKKACAEFLLNTVTEESQVGIVIFNSAATIRKQLTTMSSKSVRENMVSIVNRLIADGGTCIGCGLRRGINALEYNNMEAAGGILVVVSDGQENEDPRIADVKPDLIRKGVLVDTLLFTAAADDQLISLAKDTGGVSFFESGSAISTSLTDSLSKTITQRSSGQKDVLVQILSESFTVSGGGSFFEGSLYIDSTIGNNTRFLFTWSTGLITVTLRAPDNVTITPTAQNYGSGVLSIDINGTTQVGKWLYTVTNSGSGNATVQVQVSSRPSSDAAPIVLSASVSSDTVDIADPSLSRIVIYGEVSQGYTPVVGATVMAYVDTSRGSTPVPLLDNGAGADNTKNDGIYSAYFLKFEDNVEHSVRVIVKGEEGVSVKSVVGGQRLPIITNTTAANAAKLEVVYTPIEPFERSDSGGLFTVKNLPASTPGSEPPDLYPPGRIYDLAMEAVNTEDKTVTLSWTATGDDLDQGNASSYVIRYSTSVSQLRLNFNNTYKLLDADLIQGKLDSPLPAGAKETFRIQFNQTVNSNITYFIALLASDDKNKTGQVSNIVSVSFVYSYSLPPAEPVTSTEATTKAATTTAVYTTQTSTTPLHITTTSASPTNTDGSRVSSVQQIAIGSASAAVALLIIVVIAAAFIVWPDLKKPKGGHFPNPRDDGVQDRRNIHGSHPVNPYEFRNYWHHPHEDEISRPYVHQAKKDKAKSDFGSAHASYLLPNRSGYPFPAAPKRIVSNDYTPGQFKAYVKQNEVPGQHGYYNFRNDTDRSNQNVTTVAKENTYINFAVDQTGPPNSLPTNVTEHGVRRSGEYNRYAPVEQAEIASGSKPYWKADSQYEWNRNFQHPERRKDTLHLGAATAMIPGYEENIYATNNLRPTKTQPTPHNDSSYVNIVEPQHSAFGNQNYQPTGYTPGVSQYGNRGSQDWRGFREPQASTSTRNNAPPIVDRTTKPRMEIPQVALKMPLAHLTGRNYPYMTEDEAPRYTIYK